MTDQETLAAVTGARGLQEIALDMLSANSDLAQAKDELDAARRKETRAINRVNELQKELDAAIAGLKKAAPRDSDWARAMAHRGRERGEA